MRLAYVAMSNIPSRTADSVHVMKICSALSKALAFSKAFASVTLIAPEYPDGEKKTDDVYAYYGVEKNFDILKFSIALPKMKSKHIRRKLKLAFLLFMNRRKYDIIYSRSLYACFISALLLRKNTVFEQHTAVRQKSSEQRMFRSLINSKHLMKMVVITEALKQHHIARYDIKENEIYVAPDCADMTPESIAPIPLAEDSKGKFQVGYIGQLYKGKGVELIGQIALSCPFAFFHIIGGNKPDIAYWKDKYKDINNIHFYGFVPPSQTTGYGVNMDVLIAPYQKMVCTEQSSKPEDNIADWMSPLKIFEYMALKKPIIASGLPVIKEVLSDGVNALLCYPDDAEEWSDAIAKLYNNKELSEALVDNAFDSFVNNYTWDARAENLLQHVFLCYNSSVTDTPS